MSLYVVFFLKALRSIIWSSLTDIDLMMSHINSYKRKKLNDRSAHQLFNFYYGEDVLNKLNATLISADDIILKPSLLKK